MKVAMVARVSTTTISRIRYNTKAILNVTQMCQMVQITTTTIMRIKKTTTSGHHMDMDSSNSSNSSYISRKCINQ